MVGDAFGACEEKCEAMARSVRRRFAEVLTTFRGRSKRESPLFPPAMTLSSAPDHTSATSKVQLEESVMSSSQRRIQRSHLERMQMLSHSFHRQQVEFCDLDCDEDDLPSLALEGKLEDLHFKRMCKRDKNAENRIQRVLAALEMAFDEYEDCRVVIQDVRGMISSFFAMEDEALRVILQVWYGTISQVDVWMSEMKRELRSMSSSWIKVCKLLMSVFPCI